MNPLLCVNNTLEVRFESKLFNLFNFQRIMDNDVNNLDLNLFCDKSVAVSLPYYTVDEVSSASNSPLKNCFSI